eukprot:scaffold3886_cov78-Cylindrotheca_fusiformis.AAC.2
MGYLTKARDEIHRASRNAGNAERVWGKTHAPQSTGFPFNNCLLYVHIGQGRDQVGPIIIRLTCVVMLSELRWNTISASSPISVHESRICLRMNVYWATNGLQRLMTMERIHTNEIDSSTVLLASFSSYEIDYITNSTVQFCSANPVKSRDQKEGIGWKHKID